jgi:hypothetical protein
VACLSGYIQLPYLCLSWQVVIAFIGLKGLRRAQNRVSQPRRSARQQHFLDRLNESVTAMPQRISAIRNDYRCSIERNQTGKYCVRIQANFPRHAWMLGTFFLESSFDRAMKKLEESLNFLQHNEEKLWFWGVDRADDMGFSAEFLREAGLSLDRRHEFPRKAASLSLVPEKAVPAFVLGQIRRSLAESVDEVRVMAAAGD